jgi:hypothetical protein
MSHPVRKVMTWAVTIHPVRTISRKGPEPRLVGLGASVLFRFKAL